MCKIHGCGPGHNFHDSMNCGPMAFLHMDMGHVKNCMDNFEGWIPYDIENNESNYLVKIPLPGFSKEDVKVSLISNNLNITAKRLLVEKEKKEEDQTDNINCGVHFTQNLINFLWNKDINLDIPLPSDVDSEKIISRMNNGLLKIKIEKLPLKKIDINTGDNLN